MQGCHICPLCAKSNSKPSQSKQCGMSFCNMVSFLQNTHNRHPIACPWGRGMGCLCEFKVWSMLYTFRIVILYTIPCYVGPCYYNRACLWYFTHCLSQFLGTHTLAHIYVLDYAGPGISQWEKNILLLLYILDKYQSPRKTTSPKLQTSKNLFKLVKICDGLGVAEKLWLKGIF